MMINSTRKNMFVKKEQCVDGQVPCPFPEDALWNLHPRVYLPLRNGRVQCPYCGTYYELSE